MNLKEKMAFGGFTVVAFILIGAGMVYLLADQIMPYHLAAMESSWEKLPQGIQIMSLNFMKSVGSGMLTTGIGMTFLLAIPFRRGEMWSRWALLTISLTEILIIFFCAYDLGTKTSGGASLIPFFVLAMISISSFWLSIEVGMKQTKSEY